MIYDYFITVLTLLKAGFKNWDFKLHESLVWLVSGEVKHLDMGICNPISDSAFEHMEKNLKNRIQAVYDNDLSSIEKTLYKSGMTNLEVEQAVITFQSTTPKLV
ncbi:hypothetical protein [Paenibacillus sp. 1A_MP2]|uniref:hypothetical protein n=1 Tax=Paenibacillus sp. 1A_MP2 TaxID=3457495 RepID=UPI003FCE17F2